MGSDTWKTMLFSDAVLVNPSIKLVKGKTYPFVEMAAVTPGARSVRESEHRKFKSGGARFAPGDTLMARITPCLENGKIARFDPLTQTDAGFGSTEFIVIRGRAGVTTDDFAYYLTKWSEFRQFAIGQMTGSSGRQRVPADSLSGFEVSIPPIPQQKRLTGVLSRLDDKIECNRRLNRTLEDIVRALFKSWFIDFDPVLDNAILAGNFIPDEFAERAELRRIALDQNQPSPPAPLPCFAPSLTSLPEGEMLVEGGRNATNYRGGYDFTGMLQTVRELRRSQTPAETVLWELLRGRRLLNLKFRRQHQIGDYVADFYCHEAKLVVELDGGIHADKAAKDHKRDAFMQSLGLTVLRFPNEQLLDVPESVLKAISDSAQPDTSAADVLPSTSGRGAGGEGVVDFHHLFPAAFIQTAEMGWIPEGWEVASLSTLARLNPHAWTARNAPKHVRYIDLANTKNGRINEVVEYSFDAAPSRARRILYPGDTVFGTVRPGNRSFAYIHAEGLTGSTGFAVLHPLREAYQEFIYLATTRDEIVDLLAHLADGAAYPAVRAEVVIEQVHAMPPTRIIEAFHHSVAAEIVSIGQRSAQNQKLAAFRDTLLPKLLTGEIELPAAEAVTEGVQ